MAGRAGLLTYSGYCCSAPHPATSYLTGSCPEPVRPTAILLGTVVVVVAAAAAAAAAAVVVAAVVVGVVISAAPARTTATFSSCRGFKSNHRTRATQHGRHCVGCPCHCASGCYTHVEASSQGEGWPRPG